MPPPAPGFDHAQALARCALGDARALHGLYQAEGPWLLGVAQRIVGDRGRAEDIVHDAFVNIWQRAGSYDASRGDARGWIFSVVRHLALNAVRDSQRDVAVDDDTAAILDERRALEAWREQADAFELHASLGRLQHCLQALEPARRLCVLHAYVDGLSHDQIARKLGAPLGTVKAWVRRSLLALRECMT